MTSLQPTDRATRIAVVTAGLSAAGAVFGAVCAAASVAIIAVSAAGVAALGSGGTWGIMGASAGFGALVGTIGAPMLGWGLLRHVPLGRVLVVTALGTILGALIGEWSRPLNPYSRVLPGVIAGAFIGFLLSGVTLWLHARRRKKTASVERAV
jgi:hypothetical protein